MTQHYTKLTVEASAQKAFERAYPKVDPNVLPFGKDSHRWIARAWFVAGYKAASRSERRKASRRQ